MCRCDKEARDTFLSMPIEKTTEHAENYCKVKKNNNTYSKSGQINPLAYNPEYTRGRRNEPILATPRYLVIVQASK